MGRSASVRRSVSRTIQEGMFGVGINANMANSQWSHLGICTVKLLAMVSMVYVSFKEHFYAHMMFPASCETFPFPQALAVQIPQPSKKKQ